MTQTSLSLPPPSCTIADMSVHERDALSRVSHERDRLIDDDHKLLDAPLLELLGPYRTLNKDPNWPMLLSLITFKDQRLVTLTSEEAEKLLTREPSIGVVLQNAWKDASFKEVRRLNALWPEVHETPIRRYRRPDREDVELTTLQNAWRDIYFGNNHQLLFDNINAIETEKLYSNQIAMVQSSGTGKSRLARELANLVFTIPFNLREKIDDRGPFFVFDLLGASDSNTDLAFPIPDDAVHDYLVKNSVSDDIHTLKTNYLKFFGSVFKLVNAELDKCHKKWEQISTAAGLAKWWSSHLESIRSELYKAAIDDTAEPNDILFKSKKKDEKKTDIEFAAAEAARTALTQLIGKLNTLVESKQIKLKLVIYFDEAHPLTKVVPKNEDQKTLYDFLCSCLNEFLTLPIFCIFLSTNSSLAQFASPRALAKSARIRGGMAETHAPITETPFDCCEELMIEPGGFKMEDISKIEYMAKFGRPLFWTMLRGAKANAPKLYTVILELARAKLVASREIDSGYETFLRPARLAVIDVQLSLDFEPRREKVQVEEANLVESHMRIAFSIPNHREYLRSGYPSEPLLAEAAAQQLWVWRKQKPFAVVDTLTELLNSGLLDRGELGELVGRQLLLDAYHRAVEFEHNSKTTRPNFSAGCHLITFIKMLYTEGYADLVLNCQPDNMNGEPFKDVFKDARICFTHFGKMADDTGTTSAAAWAAFMRHMAIMCRNGQHTVDCILPVLLWDTELCEHVMTGILIQYKRRKQRGSVNGLTIDQAAVNFFPKTNEKCTHGSKSAESNPYRPYITLIMELGIQTKVADIANTPTLFKPDSSLPSSKKKQKTSHRLQSPPGDPNPATPSKVYIPRLGRLHHDPPEGHARYNIFAYGCSPTVYRGIDDAHKTSYALLLSSRDFLGEHPRKSEETLKAVRRMKPFWNGGDCYHWIAHNDTLHGPEASPSMEFGVGVPM